MSKQILSESAYFIPPADAVDGAASSSPSRRRRPARMRGKVRNWAVAAGLACLGSFVACDASAADLGVFGGGGGGGAGSYNGGGGGGAGAVIINGVKNNGTDYDGLQYDGKGGETDLTANTVSDPAAERSQPGFGGTPTTPALAGITVGNGGEGGSYIGGRESGKPGFGSAFVTAGTFSAEVDNLRVVGGGGGGGMTSRYASGGGGAGYFDGGSSGKTTSSPIPTPGGVGPGGGGGWTNQGGFGFSKPGGNGGDAEFTTTGSVTVRNGVEVASGANGGLDNGPGDSGGTGGSVIFDVATLKTAGAGAKDFSFNLRGGDINATIGALDLTTSDVKLDLIVTVQTGGEAPLAARGTFSLGDLVFGVRKTLTLTGYDAIRWNNVAAGGSIAVRGAGSVFTSDVDYAANTAGRTLSFVLDDTVKDAAAGRIMLDASGVGSVLVSRHTGTQLAIEGKMSRFANGSEIVLIRNVEDAPALGDKYREHVHKVEDSFFAYDFRTGVKDDDLVARVGRSLSPGSKSPGGSSLTVVDNVNNGFDRIQNVLADNYFQPGVIGSRFCNNQARPFVFSSIGFNSVMLRTGSHSNADQTSALVGIGARANAAACDLFYGGFIEGGYSDYSYHGKTTTGRLKADGDAKHLGVGGLLRYSLCNGLMFEGSLRVGRAWNDFNLPNDNGYKTVATYWGGHLGIGKFFQVSTVSNLELYGRFLYTRLGGDSKTVSSGYRLDIDATESTRSSLGFRYNHKIGGGFALVAGAAWEYEFAGKGKTLIDRVRTPDSSVRGSTGLAELGVKWKSDASAWDVSLKARGMVGKRQGIGGQFSVGYGF